MRSVVDSQNTVPAFLGKLWKLVNDPETDNLISWTAKGTTFCIKNQAEFARKLLPLYYKHNNMASFIRQLNMYGFHKITSVDSGGLRYDKDQIEFSHSCFVKGQAYLLEHIKRKIANPKSIVTSSDNNDKIYLKPELMNKVLTDVKHMKGKQENLDAKFSAMKQENEALWREVAILRQKHIKQQQIVNNLIQFLMSLVQTSRAGNASTNGVGVKRPYQLMINSAAHNAKKKIKSEKKARLNEHVDENMEDGPTIRELAHDDIFYSDNSHVAMKRENFRFFEDDVEDIVETEDISEVSNNIVPHLQYHVKLYDGDEETGDHNPTLSTSSKQLNVNDTSPIVTSPSTLATRADTLDPQILEQMISPLASPSTSKSKGKNITNRKKSQTSKSLLSPSNFNILAQPTDLKLPAEIFASDDSASDMALPLELPDDLILSSEPVSSDKMLGGNNLSQNFKIDKVKASKKSKKTKVQPKLGLDSIKTEHDDVDWSIATVNNNTDFNRFQNRNDIDDHIDTMQTDIDQLRELLRSDSYSLDTNTLLGLFGADDPLCGLSFNMSDDRSQNKPENEEGQLMTYTANVPDFEDINILPDLEVDNSQEHLLSSAVMDTSLNTPQVSFASPAYPTNE